MIAQDVAIIALALSLVATIGSASANEVGAYAGVTRANVLVDNGSFDARHFAVGGAFFDVAINERMSLRAGPQLLLRGYEYTSRGGEWLTAYYLDIPALFRVLLRHPARKVNPYIAAGPSAGLRVKERVVTNSCRCSGGYLPRVSLGAAAAAGLTLERRITFFVEARLDRALGGSGGGSPRLRTYNAQLLVGISPKHRVAAAQQGDEADKRR